MSFKLHLNSFHFVVVVLILQLLVKSSVQFCCTGYVPDADEIEDDLESKPRRTEIDCECGNQSFSKKYPWYVIIKKTSSGSKDSPKFCGGSVINDLIIITTIGCLLDLEDIKVQNLFKKFEFDINKITVYSNLTINTQLSEASVLPVHTINCHPLLIPSYILTNKKIDYDICVIRLVNRLAFDKNQLSPVCIPEAAGIDVVGVKARLPIWTSSTGSSLQGLNPKINIEEKNGIIYSAKECDTNSTSNRMLCTQYDDIFNYASLGDPVLVQSNSGKLLQIGITSYKFVGFDSNSYVSKPVEIFSNFMSKDIMHFIDTQSNIADAGWCKRNKNNDLNFNADKVNKFSNLPKEISWENFPSFYRSISSSCVCGIRNSINSIPHPRIIGGRDTIKNDYGWQAQLEIKTPIPDTFQIEKTYCGGSIINSKFILTAAHCITSEKDEVFLPSQVKVILRRHIGFGKGSEKGEKTFEIKRVFCHPGYSTVTKVQDDLALLELKDSIDFESEPDISPVCIYNKEEYDVIDLVGLDAIVIGWGLINPEDINSTSSVLQEIKVKIHNSEDCVLAVGGNLVPEESICAGNMKNISEYQDPSHGDSGGPLMITVQSKSNPRIEQMLQIGTLSAGTYDGLKEELLKDPTAIPFPIPIVWYTKISEYLPFIDFLSHRAGAVWCSK